MLENDFMGGTNSSFVRERLELASQCSRFYRANLNQRMAWIADFIIGDESDRYAPEPVYSMTGVRKLESKGVEGIKKEQAVLDWLQAREGKEKAKLFIKEVLQIISK